MSGSYRHPVVSDDSGAGTGVKPASEAPSASSTTGTHTPIAQPAASALRTLPTVPLTSAASLLQRHHDGYSASTYAAAPPSPPQYTSSYTSGPQQPPSAWAPPSPPQASPYRHHHDHVVDNPTATATALLSAQQQIRELLSFKSRVSEAEGRSAQSSEQLRQKAREVDELQSQLRAERRAAEAAQVEVHRLQQQLRTASASLGSAEDLEHHEARRRALEEANVRLERDLVAAHDDMDRLRAEFQQEADRSRSVAESATAKVRALEESVAVASGRDDELKSLSMRYDELQRSAQDALTALEALRKQCHNLQGECSEHLAARTTLAEKLEALRQDTRDVPAIRKAAAERDLLAVELDRKNNELAELHAALDAARKERQEASVLQQEVERLQHKLQEVGAVAGVAEARGRDVDAAREEQFRALRHLSDERETAAALRTRMTHLEAEARHLASELHGYFFAARKQQQQQGSIDYPETSVDREERNRRYSPRQTPSPLHDRGTQALGGNNANDSHSLNASAVNFLGATSATLPGASAATLSGLVATHTDGLHGTSIEAPPQRDGVADDRHAALAPLRDAVARLMGEHERLSARCTDLHKSLQLAEHRVAEQDAELRQGATETARAAMARTKVEQDGATARRQVEDYAASHRHTRRELLALGRLVQREQRALEQELGRSSGTDPSALRGGTTRAAEEKEKEEEEADEDDAAAPPTLLDASVHRFVRDTQAAIVRFAQLARASDTARRELEANNASRATAFAQSRAEWTKAQELASAEHDSNLKATQASVGQLKDTLSRVVVRHDETVSELATAQAALAEKEAALLHQQRTLEGAQHDASAASQRARAAEDELVQVRAQLLDADRGREDARDDCDEANERRRRAESERDALGVMLNCAVSAVQRLRSDVQEVLLQRSLLSSWIVDLERGLEAISSTASMMPVAAAAASDGQEGEARAAREVWTLPGCGRNPRPSQGAARFRCAALVVLVATRLRRLVAPTDEYSTAHKRARYRPTQLTGPRRFLKPHVAIDAMAVPAPAVPEVLACVPLEEDTPADAVVEKLLRCYHASRRLTTAAGRGGYVDPAAAGGVSFSESTFGVSSVGRGGRSGVLDASYPAMAGGVRSPTSPSSSRARGAAEAVQLHPALLAQLVGTELDVTMLRRLAAGQCSIRVSPKGAALRTPSAIAGAVCGAVRDVQRMASVASGDGARVQKKLQRRLNAVEMQRDDLEDRVAQLTRRLRDLQDGQAAATATDAASRHETRMQHDAAEAERRRAERALEALSAHESAIREERHKLQMERAQDEALAATSRSRKGSQAPPGLAVTSATPPSVSASSALPPSSPLSTRSRRGGSLADPASPRRSSFRNVDRTSSFLETTTRSRPDARLGAATSSPSSPRSPRSPQPRGGGLTGSRTLGGQTTVDEDSDVLEMIHTLDDRLRRALVRDGSTVS